MEFKPTKTKASRAGFTVMEMLVGLAVGALVLGAAVSFFLFGLRSFGSMANYTDLNSKDRYATDVVTRDIRNALSVVSATTNQIVLNEPPPGNAVTFTYDPSARTLTRTDSTSGRVLLTGVSSCSFSLYQRPGTNAIYNVFPAGTAATAKMVAYQWSCKRRLAGTHSESESVQMAKISLRNE
jgi:prepilin-type N-terminal cleavage/methylation domain-containing protein